MHFPPPPPHFTWLSWLSSGYRDGPWACVSFACTWCAYGVHMYRSVCGGGRCGPAWSELTPELRPPDKTRGLLPALLIDIYCLTSNFAPCNVSAGRSLASNLVCPSHFTNEQTETHREEVICPITTIAKGK